MATPVFAGPTRGEAKVQFDKGVAAYTKGDFAAAATALGKSYALKHDPETLFAWAQSERRLDRCDKALDLYAKLLKLDLPPANKDAVKTQIAECKDILAAAAKPEPKEEPKVEPKEEPKEEPKVIPKLEPKEEPKIEPKVEPRVDPIDTVVRDREPHEAPEGRSWWKDPVGDTLLGLGVVGLGVGTVFIVSGHSAENDKLHAMNYFQYRDLEHKATSDGQIGVISMISGGVLVATSFAWYLTHRDHEQRSIVTGWIVPGSGGVAISGGF